MGAENRRMRAIWIGLAVVVVWVATACGSDAGNKSGAHVTSAVSLRYEVPDDGDPPAQVFADSARTLSHESLRVNHDLTSPYTSADPANELRLAHALETGKVPIGYLPARAWAVAGVPEFRALLAPFVLTTQRASIALASGPVATTVLQSLPRSVVGLGLVPQEARRVLSVRPPTSVAALRGLRIRIVDNPQTAADMRAVGARPVEHIHAQEASRLLIQHRLDAVESNAGSILNNGYQTVAHYLSTWSPFAKFQTIVVNRKVWDGLSDGQRTALRAAAHAAVVAAVRALPTAERTDLLNLCEAGVQPAQPSDDDLSHIASAMYNATPQFPNDPAAGELIGRLLSLPGSGIQARATQLPQRCLEPAPPPQAASGGPTIPNGVYKVTDSAQDWLKGDVQNPDFLTAITYVTTMKNGRFFQTQSPNYPDQGPFRGTYAVHGNEVTFVMTSAGVHGENSIAAPETVKWSYFDGKLTLKNVVVADPASRVLYAAHPWVKIR